MLTPLIATALEAPGIRHGFFNRDGGVSTGIYAALNCGPGSDDDLTCVMENRARVEHALGISTGGLVTLYQHHSADVVEVTAPWRHGDAPKADGMVSTTPGIALGILTADCAPVLFADPGRRIIGAAHAGWKGALSGVLENTVALMETMGAERANIRASIGPTISKANYEVGPEFRDRFLDDTADNARYFTSSSKPRHFMFDLPAYVQDRLSRAGVKHIKDTGLCTYDETNRLFSYRRATHMGEDGYGRNISVIALEG